MLPQCHQPVEIAAEAKAAIPPEIAVAVEHRQARQFDRHVPLVGRPVQFDADPGLAARQRLLDPPLRIQRKILRDVVPRPSKTVGGSRPDQSGEFIGAEREAALGVGLPDEPQRVSADIRFR